MQRAEENTQAMLIGMLKALPIQATVTYDASRK